MDYMLRPQDFGDVSIFREIGMALMTAVRTAASNFQS